jgi:hypothetical protein
VKRCRLGAPLLQPLPPRRKRHSKDFVPACFSVEESVPPLKSYQPREAKLVSSKSSRKNVVDGDGDGAGAGEGLPAGGGVGVGVGLAG